jgi:hypothetical protein
MAKRINVMPGNAGGKSWGQGTTSEGIGIRSKMLGGPYGKGCSEIFENNEEAAQGST